MGLGIRHEDEQFMPVMPEPKPERKRSQEVIKFMKDHNLEWMPRWMEKEVEATGKLSIESWEELTQ